MKKKRKNKFPKIFNFLFYISLTIILLYSLLFFKITKIQVDPPEIEKLAEKYFLNKSPLIVILNLKKFLKENKEIISAELIPDFWNRKLIVKIKKSEIIAQIYDKRNNKIFYLDNYGRILDINFDDGKKIKIVSYKSIKNNSLLNPKLTKLFSLLFEFSNFYNFPIKEITIYSNFDLSFLDKNNRIYLLDPNKDIEEQIKKLYIFLQYEKKKSLGSIKRIDLRIPKKIYFK